MHAFLNIGVEDRERRYLIVIALSDTGNGPIITADHSCYSLAALWRHIPPRPSHILQIDLEDQGYPNQ